MLIVEGASTSFKSLICSWHFIVVALADSLPYFKVALIDQFYSFQLQAKGLATLYGNFHCSNFVRNSLPATTF